MTRSPRQPKEFVDTGPGAVCRRYGTETEADVQARNELIKQLSKIERDRGLHLSAEQRKKHREEEERKAEMLKQQRLDFYKTFKRSY